MDTILSVKQLTERMRQTVENRFPYVWVRGEVTNVSRPSSGHVYFSLKEADTLLSCVWFRGHQKDEMFDPLTGEVWEDGPHPCLAKSMTNGQSMICAGRLTIYGAKSQYQMIIDLAQQTGLGLWHQEFEALKRRLEAEGLFDPAHKRPLPHEPQKVAVVTAPQGAAIRDFLRISSCRGLGAQIRIYPTPVQGEDAPSHIISALQTAVQDHWAQVIVLIRGGGSIQDLWAFNNEDLARTVYQCPVPVLTGIGHEIDHSITDFTADYSAATPSHTAQILWQDRTVLAQHIDTQETALSQICEIYLARLDRRLFQTTRLLSHLSPSEHLRTQLERLHTSMLRMTSAMNTLLLQHTHATDRFRQELERMPEQLTKRMDTLKQYILSLSRTGETLLMKAESTTERMLSPLPGLGKNLVLFKEHQLAQLELQLHALDPKKPLSRGYAFAQNEDGSILRSIHQTSPGKTVSISLVDGHIYGIVTSLQPEDTTSPVNPHHSHGTL
jgi:exodeoxyribonuclease VII large subunit